MFGGRIAEEIIFGSNAVTTGASNDIERVTDIARNMVTKWGLSQKLGPLTYSDDEGEVFLGKSVTQQKIVSDETAHLIDEEVRNIVDRNYKRALDILENNKDKLHVMADALIRYESLDTGQIDEIMEGKKPSPPSDWSDNNTPREMEVALSRMKPSTKTQTTIPKNLSEAPLVLISLIVRLAVRILQSESVLFYTANSIMGYDWKAWDE